MRKLLALLTAAVLLGTSQPGSAVPLSTLLEGGTLRVDDKVFFDWTLVSLVVTDPNREPDLGLIEVIPLEDQPRNPGIRFEATGELVVTDLNFLDLDFTFRVRALDPSFRIKDNSLEIVAFEFGGEGGVIAIVETVFDTDGRTLANKFVQSDQRSGIFDLFDAAAFAPQQEILVEKDIFLAGDFLGDSVQLNVFEQRFSQVPEPPALALFVLALTAIAVIMRRRWMRS